MKANIKVLSFCLLTFIFSFSIVLSKELDLSQQQVEDIAKLVWKNECGGRIDGLTSWNKGEEFASLGVGHFIWYPEGKSGVFEEEFPPLLDYIQSCDHEIPQWIKENPHCPWKSREDFHAHLQDERMRELREFLMATIALQARYMAERLEQVLARISVGLSEDEQNHVSAMFFAVAAEKNGCYALLDYLNFKGAGVLPSERYTGEGWGLLQVLKGMHDDATHSSMAEFVRSAKEVLMRRVEHSPVERNERRWLKGWNERLDTYLK